MTEEEQRKIFAKNLNYYISNSGKQQKEVAEALGFPQTTFNTWCTGKIMPKMGKVQAIADYFKILKSDLIDDKSFKEPSEEFLEIVAKLGADDEQFQKIIIDYYHMSTDRKKVFCEFFNTFVSGNYKGKGDIKSPFPFLLYSTL